MKLDESGSVEVAVTNGGMGSQFRKLVERHPHDRKQFHYYGFEPISFAQKRKALTHFIYNAITMRYSLISADSKVSKFSNNPVGLRLSYDDTLANCIYLNHNNKSNSFISIKENAIDSFKRKDHEDRFTNQITGNCTIHNLKFSLKNLFNMNELDLGNMIDQLLIACDESISIWFPNEENK